jgi:hypothetical protein
MRIFSAVRSITIIVSQINHLVFVWRWFQDYVFSVSDHVHRFMFFRFFFLWIGHTKWCSYHKLAYSRSFCFCFLPLSSVQYVPTQLPPRAQDSQTGQSVLSGIQTVTDTVFLSTSPHDVSQSTWLSLATYSQAYHLEI